MKIKLAFYTLCLVFVALANEEVKMNNKGEEYTAKSSIESVERDNVSSNLENDYYIIIGDTRTIEMDKYCDISSNSKYTVIANNNSNHDNLINQVLPEVEDIHKSKTECNIKVVICTDINDLTHLDKYLDTYNTIKNDYDLVLVSLNPIEYTNSITNTTIEMFNNNLKNIEGVQYIDTYTTLKNKGFETRDGVNYTEETYKDIWNIIEKFIVDKN